MKKFARIGIFFAVAILSFSLFLFLFFPYQILKEAIALKASEISGMNIAIDELSLKFPIGFDLRGVSIQSTDGKEMKFDVVLAEAKTLPLFLGSLGFQIKLVDNKKGFLTGYVKTGLFSLLTGKPEIKALEINSENLHIGELFDFSISALNQAEVFSPLLKPLLESIDIEGKMNSKIDLSIDVSNPQKTNGVIEFVLADLAIKSLNENIPLPAQNFKKAGIVAGIKAGAVTFDAKKSGLLSQDLTLDISGAIQQKSQISNTNIDISIAVALGAGLADQLGLILDAVAQQETQGKLNIKIKGSLANWSVEF